MDTLTSNEIYDNLKCIVCFEFAKDAVECLQCGNVFCKFCVINIKCPLCRSLSAYKDSFFARKIIDSFPIKCVKCFEITTKGGLDSHILICKERSFTCKIINCKFEGKKEEFIKHISNTCNDFLHLNQVLNELDVNRIKLKNNYLSLLNAKINAVGKQSRRGITGRFYCGEKSDVTCGTCDGNCGPTNGCNCTDCIKLDIEFYNLPLGFMLNHDGNFCQLIDNKFYCGVRMNNSIYCSPDDQACGGCGKISNIVVIKNFIKAMIENDKKEIKLELK